MRRSSSVTSSCLTSSACVSVDVVSCLELVATAGTALVVFGGLTWVRLQVWSAGLGCRGIGFASFWSGKRIPCMRCDSISSEPQCCKDLSVNGLPL